MCVTNYGPVFTSLSSSFTRTQIYDLRFVSPNVAGKSIFPNAFCASVWFSPCSNCCLSYSAVGDVPISERSFFAFWLNDLLLLELEVEFEVRRGLVEELEMIEGVYCFLD